MLLVRYVDEVSIFIDGPLITYGNGKLTYR